MHKTDAVRLLGGKAFCGQKVALRSTRAHGADHVGADGGGDQADLHLREAKLGAVHTHGHVAGGHQAHAAGVHVALNAGDGRLGTLGDGLQHLRQLARVAQVLFVRVIGHGAHPVQIATGAKRGALSGQDHHTHIAALAHIDKGLVQLGDEIVVESVAHLGAVQGDARDLMVDAQGQGGTHRAASSCRK